ncbi:MAG: hypothetical protein IPJ56_08660 [Gemmatimonadetes bacterium]|nr:hypothetical protein [Gemmatimonadota bacterium]
MLAAFFASIVLILLVSSEFTWRTSRQNVIDGLSKEEFFGAKLFLLPGVGLFFFIVMVLVAGGFAFAGTVAKGVLGSTGALVRPADLALMGGSIIGLLGWASLAFLLAIAIRSSGSAIGAFFLYFIVEQILGQLAGRSAPRRGSCSASRLTPSSRRCGSRRGTGRCPSRRGKRRRLPRSGTWWPGSRTSRCSCSRRSCCTGGATCSVRTWGRRRSRAPVPA